VQIIGPIGFTLDFGTSYDDIIGVLTTLSYRF
jgi:hypothetical protein